MGEFSLSHILILGVVLIVFFGPSRLPGVAKGLGEAIRDFKKSLAGEEPPPPAKQQITKSESSNDAQNESAAQREKQKQNT